MTLLGVRLISLFSLFGLTMLTGLGPIIVFILWKQRQEQKANLDGQSVPISRSEMDYVKSTKSAKILQLLLIFGGGVLLATCFVHMIPEIKENYARYLENQDSRDEQLTTTTTTIIMKEMIEDDTNHNNLFQPVQRSYNNVIESKDDVSDSQPRKVPWVEICICIGLFVTYFIEEAVLLLIGNSAHHSHHHHHHDDEQSENHHKDGPNVREKAVCIPENCEGDYGTLLRPALASRTNSDDSINKSTRRTQSLSKSGILRINGYDNVILDVREAEPTSSGNRLTHESQWSRFLRGLIVIVAFMAHSIFDGVAIGLQTTANSLWTMFFAICLHKLVVVFAIGFELFEKTGSLLLTSIHIAIFASMSPLGIFLAILTEQGLSEDSSLTIILLNAVATGAILYIVFLEILQADRCPEINGLIQLAALVTGFTLMTCVTVLVGDGD